MSEDTVMKLRVP